MRRASLLLTAARTLRWTDDTLNPPAAGEVLVRTLYGAVSLGTELPLYLGSSRSSTPPTYPA